MPPKLTPTADFTEFTYYPLPAGRHRVVASTRASYIAGAALAVDGGLVSGMF